MRSIKLSEQLSNMNIIIFRDLRLKYWEHVNADLEIGDLQRASFVNVSKI